MRRAPALPLLLLSAVLGFGASAARAAPPEAPDPDPKVRTEGAVAALRSPFLRERQEAARLLRGLLPGSRASVLRAWEEGDEAVRATLAGVLVAEASPEAVALVVDAWCNGGDALAATARGALILDPDATRKGLAAWRAGRGAGGRTRRTPEALDELLLRDEVERLFLSRKSKSGGTGVYRGQYDVLRPHREMALQVCLHVLTDRAMRLPGTSAVGGYRFLRPLRDVFDAWEIRGMALFALSDLTTAADTAVVAALHAYLVELEDVPDSPPGGWRGQRPDADWRPEKDYLFDDLLVTLYRLDPARYRLPLFRRLAFRDSRARYSPEASAAISMRLRAGMYEAAERGYRAMLWDTDSRAADYYNLACTYALWSLEPGNRDPAVLRRQALDALRNAVNAQWTDIAWLEQDRDLDPIRDTDEFRALVERIRTFIAGDKGMPQDPDER